MATALRIPTEFRAIDRFTSVLKTMSAGVSGFSASTGSAIERLNKKMSKVGTVAAIGATALVGGLGVSVNKAIDFEDKMADVAKTTGLSGKALEGYGNSLLDMSSNTRTGIDDLIKIGEVGGQLGIASKDLISFTEASNKFAVALGEDYGGTEEAITQVGKINSLFKDTKNLDAASSISKVGSAINELGAVGSGTSANINDFILRIGALPDAIKPTLTQTAALGTFFEEVGIDSQIASGGFSNFLLVAGKNISGFAKQMGISTKAAKDLYAQDPTKFATKFAMSLNGLAPDKLAKKLDKLKIGSQESIKVIGALGSGSERLGELMGVSSDAFVKATSLTDEYNKKNETTAAKIAKAKNGIDAFMIILGTQLLPVLGDIIEQVTPLIKGFGDWAKENKSLGKQVLFVVGGLYAIKAISVLVTAGIWAYNVAIGIQGALTGTASIAIGANAVALGAYKIASGLATAAQWALNAAMSANPISLIIIGIAALIGLVVLITEKWDSWGASITLFMGPLGIAISLVQAFRNNWDNISDAFTNGGIIDGILAIGATILDVLLYPIQQLMGLLAKIPGLGGLAGGISEGIGNFRESLGINTSGPQKLDTPEQVTSQLMQQNQLKGNININVKDKGNNVGNVDTTGFGGIPVNTTSTQGAF